MKKHEWVKTPQITTDLAAVGRLNEKFDVCPHCTCIRIRINGTSYQLKEQYLDEEPECIERPEQEAGKDGNN